MTRIAAVVLVLVGVAVLPATGSAQDLQDGMWSGTMTPPDGTDVPITYQVSHPNAELAITFVSPMGNSSFSDIRFEDGVLLFSWSPGPLLECELEPQEKGGYYGDCIDDSGTTGQLRMTPPGDEE